MRKAYGHSCVRRAPATLQCRPTFPAAPKTFRHNILFSVSLPFLGVCLAAGLLAAIALEAFDQDLSLWQPGAEEFALAPRGLPVTGRQLGWSAITALVALGLVRTAGERLAVRCRGRSALQTDELAFALSPNVAEPWCDIRMPHWDSAMSFVGATRCLALGPKRGTGRVGPAFRLHISRVDSRSAQAQFPPRMQ